MSDQVLFEIKQKFLQQVPHPKLIQSSIDRLNRQLDEPFELNKPEEQVSNEDLKEYLEVYLDRLLKLKLEIANAPSSHELISSLVKLKGLHMNFINSLSEWSSHLPEDYVPRTEIKLSDTVDAYEILRFVSGNFEDRNQIKEYLRGFNSAEENVLVLQLIRCRRIIEQLEKNG